MYRVIDGDNSPKHLLLFEKVFKTAVVEKREIFN